MSHNAADVQSIFFAAIDKLPQERESFLQQACRGDQETRIRVEKLLRRLEHIGDFLPGPIIEFGPVEDTPRIDADKKGGQLEADGDVFGDAKTVSHVERGQAVNRAAAGELRCIEELPRIPGYEIIREIARGGMGVIYKAKQIQANRIVALKMILSDVQADTSTRERFRLEAEAIARLQHPNIVQIFEVGEHHGRPYFSMEYCPAGSLAQFLSGTPLPSRQAGELIMQLAQAVQAAHEMKVIHRDLKPANVLFASHPGAAAPKDPAVDNGRPPLSSLNAKVADFGLAKKLDDVTRTRTGLAMGTPSYMSPEQARGKKDAGPQTDVYSLGAILYECLTGRPPFKTASSIETALQVVNSDPVSPRVLQPGLSRDLETICLKCLEKDPAKRYSTAQALAEELGRYLQGSPILARPVSTLGRAAKWVRRYPVYSALLLTLGFAIFAGSGFSTWFAIQAQTNATNAEAREKDAQKAAVRADLKTKEAEKEKRSAEIARDEADREKAIAQHIAYDFQVNLSAREWELGKFTEARHLLEQTPKDLRGWEYNYLRRQYDKEAREGYQVFRKPLVIRSRLGHIPHPTLPKIFSLWGVTGQDMIVWDFVTGKDERVLAGHDKQIMCMVISADGKRLVTGSQDSTVKIWDAVKMKEIKTLRGHDAAVRYVFLMGDERYLASIDDKSKLIIWDFEKETAIDSFQVTERYKSVSDPYGPRIAFHVPDGNGKMLVVYDCEKRTATKSHPSWPVQFGPGGQLAVSRGRGRVELISMKTGAKKEFSFSIDKPVQKIVFSPDGKYLAAVLGNPQTEIGLVNLEKGEAHLKFETSQERYANLIFTPDSKRLISAELNRRSQDAIFKIWELQGFRATAVLKNPADCLFAGRLGPRPKVDMGFSGNGKYLVCSGQFVTVRDSTSFFVHRFVGMTHQINGVALRPDAKQFAVMYENGQSRGQIWDVATGKPKWSIGISGLGKSIDYSPDGKLMAVARQKRVELLDAETGKLQRSFPNPKSNFWAVAFSPNGKLLAMGNYKGVITYLDISTGKPLFHLEDGKGKGAVSKIVFSADGKRLAASFSLGRPAPGNGWFDRAVYVWDLSIRKVMRRVETGKPFVFDFDLSNDGKQLAVASGDTVSVWDVDKRNISKSFKPHKERALSVDFNSDGSKLLTGGGDGFVRIWDLGTFEQTFSFHGHRENSQARWGAGDAWVLSQDVDFTCCLFKPSGRKQSIPILPNPHLNPAAN